MSIKIKNLSKSFNDLSALDNINLELENEKIYGLFGRNGSGKSTLLNIIADRISTYDGEILFDSEKSNGEDKLIGKIYVMSDLMLYPEGMKIKDAYRWSKEFYDSFDMDYALELSKKFDLNINKKVDKLSTGYTSIFKLIIALSVNTPYVFYDEPILGLDANFREVFYKELIFNYSENPKTIVVCSHLIDEISSIIEHVFVINKGKIIVDEETEKLLENGYTVTGNVKEVDDFIKGKKVLGTESLGLYKSAHIYEKLDKSKLPDNLEVSKMDLQKLFIELTNC